MQLTYNNNKLKIDNGDHYYLGIINKDDFPDIISNDYEDIIVKSFNNFTNETTNISYNIVDDNFIIYFEYNSKPLKFSESIKIKISRFDKDFKDYINERIEKIENENKEIKMKLAELIGINRASKLTEELGLDDDDDDDSVVEPVKNVSQSKVVKPIKKTNQKTAYA